MNLLVVVSLLASFPVGLYIFAGKKITWTGIEDMISRYRYHFFILISVGLMKSAMFYLEKPVETLWAINLTPMIHEFEGNRIFWFQHLLENSGMTVFMAIIYVFGFLFIMVFTLILFSYLDMKRVASRMMHLYLVVFLLMVPFYLFVIVYTPSYPKMFYPGANSIITGMQPLLYNYGPNVNDFFMNYDTFNNCFPSLHIGYPAAIAMLIFLDVKGFKRYKAFLLVMLFLIAVAIIYLGIHWLTDIIGGLFIAIISVIITDRYAYGFWKRVNRCHNLGLKWWNHNIKKKQND